LYFILLTLSKLIAPFMPFLIEKMFSFLKTEKMLESVHLEKWPKADKKLIDKKLEAKMKSVRKICELGHSLRKKAGIKVRQPLGKLKIKNEKLKIEENLLNLIKDELNVKEVELVETIKEKENWLKVSEGEIEVALNTEITSELKNEGMLREIARQISGLRKEAGLTIQDKAIVYFETGSEEIKELVKKFNEEIKVKTSSENLIEKKPDNFLLKKQIDFNNKKIDFYLVK